MDFRNDSHRASTLIVLLALILAGCRNLGVGGLDRDANLLFEDDFSDALAGGWHLEADAHGQAEIVDGKLRMNIGAPATVQYTTLADQVFSDFIADVEATQVGGPPGGSYGMLVRMVAPGQFYRFEVATTGEYVVERHDGEGTWERLTDGWQESEAIKTGLNETNHLRIAVLGGRFSFYVNDELLVQVVDSTYATGAMALDVGTFNQSELQVTFDNFVVTAP